MRRQQTATTTYNRLPLLTLRVRTILFLARAHPVQRKKKKENLTEFWLPPGKKNNTGASTCPAAWCCVPSVLLLVPATIIIKRCTDENEGRILEVINLLPPSKKMLKYMLIASNPEKIAALHFIDLPINLCITAVHNAIEFYQSLRFLPLLLLLDVDGLRGPRGLRRPQPRDAQPRPDGLRGHGLHQLLHGRADLLALQVFYCKNFRITLHNFCTFYSARAAMLTGRLPVRNGFYSNNMRGRNGKYNVFLK